MSDTEENLTQEKLHSMRQRYSQVADELTQELSRLQESYRQLGQRAGTLASERDALRASLDEARRSSDSNRAELEALKEEHARIVHDLQTRLTGEETLRNSLREEIASLTRQHAERMEAFKPLEHELAELQASAQKGLLREKKLLNERDTILRKLEDANSNCAAAEEGQRALEAQLIELREEAESSREGYVGRIAGLEDCVAGIESERDAARRQAAEYEVALFEHTSRQIEELEHALEQARSTAHGFERAPETEPPPYADNRHIVLDHALEPADEISGETSEYKGDTNTT